MSENVESWVLGVTPVTASRIPAFWRLSLSVANTPASGYRHFRVGSLCLAFVDYLGSKKLVCQGSNTTMLHEQGPILCCYNSLCSCHDNCSVDNPSYHSDGCDVILHSFIHHLARKHWSYLSFSGIRGVFSLLLMSWSSCNFLLSTSSQLLFDYNFPVCALCSAVYYCLHFNTQPLFQSLVIIGVSLSESHTSVTALQDACTCPVWPTDHIPKI